MARGIYTLSGDNITLQNVALQTLLLIRPSAARGLDIRRAWCSQRGTTTQQQFGIRLGFRTLTTVPTLIAKTPEVTLTGDAASLFTGGTAAAAGTCGIAATAEGTGATSDAVVDNFNNVAGYQWFPPDRDGELVAVGGSALAFAIQLIGTPVTLTGWSFGVEFRER